MQRTLPLFVLLALLAACGDGQPLFADSDGDGIPDDQDDTPNGDPVPEPQPADPDGDSAVELAVLPGTTEPEASEAIARREAPSASGAGIIGDVRYDATNDTFFVDNLAFDGDNVYARAEIDPLGPSGAGSPDYVVYEGDQVAYDTDGQVIDQLEFRAIYAQSPNTVTVDGEDVPLTSLAIVRDAEEDYAFGGFIFQRNSGLEMPTAGQGRYTGDYAGMRVPSDPAAGPLQYTRGDVDLAIDFRDFNASNGVSLTIDNRRAYDLNGNSLDITLPDIETGVRDGVMSGAGEIVMDVTYEDDVVKAGTFYAIVAGEDASEVVGVIALDGPEGQETGGFIVYR